MAYKGSVEDTVFQLIGGLKSGMGYCGTPTIEELKERGRFVKISAASTERISSACIHITKEAAELQRRKIKRLLFWTAGVRKRHLPFLCKKL